MSVVCLGWGSLIWRGGELKLSGRDHPWLTDGPEIPVEFARQSDSGLMTLVLTPRATPVRVLWAELDFINLDDARANLAARERTSVTNIATWKKTDAIEREERIAAWASDRDIDAVIWTDLRPKFSGVHGRIPSCAEAIEYFKSLNQPTRRLAEEYVRRTPPQVSTPYRAEFEAVLGWTYDGELTDKQIRTLAAT